MIATLIAWAKSLMPKPVNPEKRRRRFAYGGPNRKALAAWIDRHMPELGAELDPLTLDQVRIRLNEITGCNELPTGPVEAGSAVFLEALKKMKEAS